MIDAKWSKDYENNEFGFWNGQELSFWIGIGEKKIQSNGKKFFI